MAVIEIFSTSVHYKYKSKLYSFSFLIVLFFTILSLLTPFFIIYNAGGFSLKNRVYIERPDVLFNYKYLLLVDRGYNVSPIVCSSFTTYKDNKITDDCILVKVQEIDTNSDGKKDILKLEAHFYTNVPVRSYEEVQKVQFYGDLMLQQKGLLTNEGLYETYNQSIEMAHYSLEELLLQSANRKFAAKINNEYVTKQVGHSSENTVVVCAEIIYRDGLIHYQPSIWEELKWAWVQYLSCLLVLTYIVKHTMVFLFSKRYLNSYIVIPWREK